MGKGIVKLGEGNWAVKDGKLLAAKETNSRFKNTEFTVARGTRATYVGRDGLIANEAGNDTPRIDFTGNTDGHLLLEPESRNLVTYSEDFSQSDWSENDAQILSSTHVNPDGSNNAKVLAYEGGSVQHYISTTPSVDSGQNYTFSIFVKAKELNYVCLVFLNDLSGKFFNLENGTRLGNFGSEPFDSKIEDYGNGWYRCSITDNATSTTKFCGIYLSDNGTSINSTPTTTNGVYIYGAQLEKLSYPTSYIPTNGSQVTRDAEIVSRESIDEIDIPQEEGTIYLELEGYEKNTEIFNFDRSTSNSIHVGTDNDGVLKVWGYYEPSGTGTSTSAMLNNNTKKVAIAFKNGSFIVYADGEEELNTSTFVWTPTDSIDRLYFNRGGYIASQGLSKVKALRIYKEAFNTTQLDELTS
jgi:hypothetical protein